MMSPKELIALIVTDDHVGNSVSSTESGAWAKGKDALLAWLTECAHQMESIAKNTAI